MRFHGLDLNLLVALDALLTEKSVSAAAERLHLSQPAMSGMLDRLRDSFGDELLTSVGRRMVLTARGEGLVEPVRCALLQIERTITTAPDFDPTLCDRALSISALDFAISAFLLERLKTIARFAPGMRFRILSPGDCVIDQGGPASLLERGELDFYVAFEGTEHPGTQKASCSRTSSSLSRAATIPSFKDHSRSNTI